MPEQSESDRRLELAYGAAEKKLSMQDATLASVRTRATNLLAIAALFTSFSAWIGVINIDPTKGSVLGPVAGIGLLTLVVLLGVSVLVVVWPVKVWAFVPWVSKIMQMNESDEGEASIRKTVIERGTESPSRPNRMPGKHPRAKWSHRSEGGGDARIPR